ncbi:FkbM family methyltransferase [Patescibacteria group bacterium]
MLTQEKKLFLFILFIKLAILFFVAVVVGGSGFSWSGDGLEYIDLGTNLINGDGFSETTSEGLLVAETKRMPLYPFIAASLLKLSNASFVWPISLFQAFLAAFIAVLVFRIACFFMPTNWAFVPAVIISIEPVISALHVFVFAETLLVFFVLLFVYNFLKYLEGNSHYYLVFSIFSLVLACYTKPIALYLIVVPIIILLYKNWKHFLVVVFMAFFLFLPWIARNAVITGKPTLSTNGNDALCGYQLPAILAGVYGFPDSSPAAAIGEMLNVPEYKAIYDKCISASAFETIKDITFEYPYASVKSIFFTSLAFYTNDGISSIVQDSDSTLPPHHNYLSSTVFLGSEWKSQIKIAISELTALEFLAIFILKAFWIAVFILAFYGVIKIFSSGTKNKINIVLLILVILYFTGASVLGGGIGTGARYRYHITALLLLLSTFGFLRLYLLMPLTRIKIWIARMLYYITTIIYGNKKRQIIRNGITFEVDLSEGLDLSLFIFGNFQKHIYKNKNIFIPKDGVIFDIGANIGIMALNFATQVPDGKVLAFEPTHYGCQKLIRNVQFNPSIAKRIELIQSFVSGKSSETSDLKAYASWNVGHKKDEEAHSVHGGLVKSAEGVNAISLDDFIQNHKISRVDLIKIDTDGHEFEILKGAQNLIKSFNPVIIFEVGLYIMKENDISFKDYIFFFSSLHYNLYDSGSGDMITENNYLNYIPKRGTIDVIAKSNIR